MDEKTVQNLRDAGCPDALIDELAGLPCGRARIRRLKEYRRDLLGGIHAEQRKLDCLDYLIHQLSNDA